VVEEVRGTLDDKIDGAIFVEIFYRIKSTHDQRSIVYPFFIEDEG